MNENAKKWVEALRSGKYEQVKGSLRRRNGFCCLGVACEISEIGHWSEISNEYVTVNDGDEHKEDAHLPDAVQFWLGLRNNYGGFDEYIDGCGSLVNLNDEGKSFSEIADIIEKYQDQLFVK